MNASLHHLSAISLFVEDLRAAKAFYAEVFGVAVLFEDAASVAFKFDNLLRVEDAHEIVAPGAVAARDAGARFQLAIWVPDVDAVCARLRERGVALNGPIDRPWGMRTANFVDPAGHGWEVGQRMVQS